MISLSEKNLLIAKVTGFHKERIFREDFELDSDQQKELDKLLKLREKEYPMAYILGYKEFYGKQFVVNENVLIPRAESESLIDVIIQNVGSRLNVTKDLKILDMGCGSGVLGITLGNQFIDKKCEVTLVDISSSALEIAGQNAKKHLDECYKLIKSDLFENIEGEFDVVVANLPYVEKSFINDLPVESKSIMYEPDLALESGEDGLDHYRRFFQEVWGYLSSNFIICVECDPQQIDDLLLITDKHESKVFKDMAGIDRGITITGKE